MIGAIIDIGSGSIGLATVLLEKDRVPVLRYSSRKELRMEKTLTPNRLLSRSIESLKSAVEEMQKKGADVPSVIFCFLSPHLIVSETRTINIEFNELTKIDDSVIQDLVDKDLAELKVKRVGRFRGSASAMIEEKIMRVRLNGYEVSNVNNKFANEVEISIFSTITSDYILNSLKNSITNFFHNTQIEFHSFPFAYFNALRDISQSENDFIFIDVGSEITDVSLATEGVFVKSVTFPYGKNSILRLLIDKTKKDESIVKSMLKNYIEDMMEKKMKANFDSILASAGTRWVESVKSTFNELGREDNLPKQIFILADKDISGIFKKFIDSISPSDFTILNKKPDSRELTVADFNKFHYNKSGSRDDLFLAISAIFVNKLLN